MMSMISPEVELNSKDILLVYNIAETFPNSRAFVVLGLPFSESPTNQYGWLC